jgi:hypothetical protein
VEGGEGYLVEEDLQGGVGRDGQMREGRCGGWWGGGCSGAARAGCKV